MKLLDRLCVQALLRVHYQRVQVRSTAESFVLTNHSPLIGSVLKVQLINDTREHDWLTLVLADGNIEPLFRYVRLYLSAVDNVIVPKDLFQVIEKVFAEVCLPV